MLRHSSISVTQRYAHLAPDSLHAAARATGEGTAPAPIVEPSGSVRGSERAAVASLALEAAGESGARIGRKLAAGSEAASGGQQSAALVLQRESDGAPRMIRTSDLTLRKRLLYPAELRGRVDELAHGAPFSPGDQYLRSARTGLSPSFLRPSKNASSMTKR